MGGTLRGDTFEWAEQPDIDPSDWAELLQLDQTRRTEELGFLWQVRLVQVPSGPVAPGGRNPRELHP